jgi:hypothetical protein
LLFKITGKSVIELTLSNSTQLSMYDYLIGLNDLVNVIVLHFVKLRCYAFLPHHFDIRSKSRWILKQSWEQHREKQFHVVSIKENSYIFEKQRLKPNGPRWLPCWTPEVNLISFERHLSIFTRWVLPLPENKKRSNSNLLGGTAAVIFSKNNWWRILSKFLEKSMKTEVRSSLGQKMCILGGLRRWTILEKAMLIFSCKNSAKSSYSKFKFLVFQSVFREY